MKSSIPLKNTWKSELNYFEKLVHDIIQYDVDSHEFNKAVEAINAIEDEKIRRLVLDAILDYRDNIKPQH
jgi:hypothetical protein